MSPKDVFDAIQKALDWCHNGGGMAEVAERLPDGTILHEDGTPWLGAKTEEEAKLVFNMLVTLAAIAEQLDIESLIEKYKDENDDWEEEDPPDEEDIQEALLRLARMSGNVGEA